MKKIVLLLLIGFIFISCSSDNITKDDAPVSYNKLKAYNKSISFFYYSTDGTKTGISRIYLDTINSGFTQYTSYKNPVKDDTSEEFNIINSYFILIIKIQMWII
jgi:hypothetical protein